MKVLRADYSSPTTRLRESRGIWKLCTWDIRLSNKSRLDSGFSEKKIASPNPIEHRRYHQLDSVRWQFPDLNWTEKGLLNPISTVLRSQGTLGGLLIPDWFYAFNFVADKTVILFYSEEDTIKLTLPMFTKHCSKGAKRSHCTWVFVAADRYNWTYELTTFKVLDRVLLKRGFVLRVQPETLEPFRRFGAARAPMSGLH